MRTADARRTCAHNDHKDFDACLICVCAENEQLRALLAEIDTWFVSTPDARALSSSEHFKVGCANDLFSTISEIRAALAMLAEVTP